MDPIQALKGESGSDNSKNEDAFKEKKPMQIGRLEINAVIRM